MNWLLARLREPSTWRGIVWLLTVFGLALKWQRAQSWVALYENKDIPSTEKRERVLVMLELELKTLGQELSTSLINFALEAALQYVRRTHQ